MTEFLRVGHGITSVDRKFTAVLEADCNLLVYRNRGVGKAGVKVTIILGVPLFLFVYSVLLLIIVIVIIIMIIRALLCFIYLFICFI